MDLTFILTEACNLRCSYCYQGRYPKSELDPKTAVAAARAACEHGADHLALTFFGGEPLLRREALFEILEATQSLGLAHGVPVSAKVATNGVLLDADFVRRAHRAGLFVSLSLDGTREAHDRHRRARDGAGSWNDACRALGLLADSGLPFAVYSVVTPDTAQHMAASLRFLWERGARVLVNTLDLTAEWTSAALRVLREQYREVAAFYAGLLGRREAFHLEPFDSRISQRTRHDEWQSCSPGVRQLTVAPDGTLYGCVEFAYRRLHPLGTARGWLRREAVRGLLGERKGLDPACGGCGVKDRCNKSCACLNLRTTGKINTPPASLCLSEQAAILEADALARRLYTKKDKEFLLRQYSRSFHLLRGVELLLEDLEVTA